MIWVLAIIAFVMLASAALAMTLRNLIHSALLLVLAWAGIAAFYLWAGAEFVAFAQVLVYVGAVSMVVLFAVLLTRQRPSDVVLVDQPSLVRAGLAVMSAGMAGSVLINSVLASRLPSRSGPAPELPVKELGALLMGPYAAALLVVGVILTVALVGAVILAAPEPANPEGEQ